MKTLKNNKGFTLIEIVIVIVIIAILAAMLIPSMISWIDSANQRTFLSACDSIETAVLSIASENYATDQKFDIIGAGGNANETTKGWKHVSDLVGNTVAETGTPDYLVVLEFTDKEITTFTITNENYKGTYNTADGSWDVADAPAS